MTDFGALKKSILADGVIDEQEVKSLRKILYEDGKIDRKEANFLFELNDAVSGKSNHSSWKTLMVDAISSHVLDDETSPGEIDESEAKWLISKIQKDGVVDDIEKAILIRIQKKAKKISPKLEDFIKKTV
jgi:uncharacterized tellurite resistance protein B-like protein